MKKKKLSLKSLEVSSFVTSMEVLSQDIVKGGTNLNSNYPTMPCNCSAWDGCVSAWNCPVTRADICSVAGAC